MSMLKNSVFLIALISFQVFADCAPKRPKSFGDVIVSSLVGVYDGDTFTATIGAWPPIIGEAIRVRVAGLETPEIRGKCLDEKQLARRARAFTRRALLNARTIELRNLRRDKYFRLLADVCVDGDSLTQKIIDARLGRPYEGGKKGSWCD